LDIGCNAGVLTLDVAIQFNVESILGIDIDGKLILKAFGELEKRKEELGNKFGDYDIQFLCEDYLEKEDGDQKYDVILCLSVVKWIHINFGDDGVLKLFNKVFNQLSENGRFIFEPQPWSSYKKKYFVTEEAKKNWFSIQIYPDDFISYLTDIGFVVESVVQPIESVGGFKYREIYVMSKNTSK